MQKHRPGHSRERARAEGRGRMGSAYLGAVLLGALSLFPLFGCAPLPSKPVHLQQGDYSELIRYLTEKIPAQMQQFQVQGLSIALVDDQHLVWAQGFGTTDPARKVKTVPETSYRIGSITKVFTALAIMQQVEAGRIDLDRPARDYIPGFSIQSRFTPTPAITTRGLLTHHAGLPSDWLQGMWVDRPIGLADLVTALSTEHLVSPPGSLYKYSNLGYSLLGRELEAVTQREYTEGLIEDLLRPLGMDRSFFPVDGVQPPATLSAGFRKGQAVRVLGLRDRPAGSLCSDVLDLSRFLSFLFNQGQVAGRSLLRPGTLQSMLEPQYSGLPLDLGHQVSLAWMLTGLRVAADEPVVWHNGGYPPFQAHLAFLPKSKLGVVVLANSEEASQVVTSLGEETLQLAWQVKHGRALPIPASNAPRLVSRTRADLEKVAGNYVVFGQLTPIHSTGERLKTTLYGQEIDLVPISGERFLLRVNLLWGLISFDLPDLEIDFKTIAGIELAELHGLPGPFAFAKVNPVLIPEAWRRRVGEYICDTTNEDFEFKQLSLDLEDGYLLLVFDLQSKEKDGLGSHNRFVFQPISDTQAIMAGVGAIEGGTLVAQEAAGQVVLSYSGFQLRRK